MAGSSYTPRSSIVGLGASAGGLAALERFFSAVAPDSGMTYVVVTHQQPGRPSLLPDLLAKTAKIPVVAATDGIALEANSVYVAPAACCLSLRDHHLYIEPLAKGDPRLPIDHFFRSLAEQQREQAIAVVLSGTGSDGTLGVVEVKGASGLVMAQEPSSAQYPGMPQSAIETRVCDYVLAPEKMPERLQQYGRTRYALPPEELEEMGETAESGGALIQVLSVLRNRTGHDFTSYKKSTVRRRIQRRMNVHGIMMPRDYAAYLEQTPYEVDALFRELLISVTSFFRDPEAFSALEHCMARLIERKPDESQLRAWIAGCATGEEAYSISIILLELLQRHSRNIKIQLFATDLDAHAIDVARTGRYAEGIAADVSPERLERFFVKEDSVYRIKKEVRDTVVFATQNVIKDPPFTKVDLLSCRNLLIYLEPNLQRRVLNLFSYALRPHGLLFLGTSESASGFDNRFITLDKRWKLFERREHGVAELMPEFSSEMPQPSPLRSAARPGTRGTTTQLIERALLSSFAPPTVVVSERGEIVYIHGRTGPFLEPAAGEPTNNILNMAREGLRLELPSAMRQAAAQDEPAVRQGLKVKTNGGYSFVRLTVRKLVDVDQLRGTFLVSFEIEPPPSLADADRAVDRQNVTQHYADLESELQRTRENLQGTIEELETSNEELKSTNEELQSTNEELQSANEELETSREEMQSLNEELQTVNVELEQRNRALSQTNDDMQNLLNSTDVATVFLDDKLNIKRFTTQAKKVFSLIDTDIGRPISDLSANLRDEGLLEEAREVLRTLVYHEREIQTKEGAWRLMRIMPYRTHENLIDGLVLTFIDIDRLKRNEQEQLHARVRADGVIDAIPWPLLLLDDGLKVLAGNRAFCSRFRANPKLIVGEACQNVFEERWPTAEGLQQLTARLADGSTADGNHLRLRLSDTLSRIGKVEFEVLAERISNSNGLPSLLLSFGPRDA